MHWFDVAMYEGPRVGAGPDTWHTWPLRWPGTITLTPGHRGPWHHVAGAAPELGNLSHWELLVIVHHQVFVQFLFLAWHGVTGRCGLKINYKNVPSNVIVSIISMQCKTWVSLILSLWVKACCPSDPVLTTGIRNLIWQSGLQGAFHFTLCHYNTVLHYNIILPSRACIFQTKYWTNYLNI